MRGKRAKSLRRLAMKLAVRRGKPESAGWLYKMLKRDWPPGREKKGGTYDPPRRPWSEIAERAMAKGREGQ